MLGFAVLYSTQMLEFAVAPFEADDLAPTRHRSFPHSVLAISLGQSGSG